MMSGSWCKAFATRISNYLKTTQHDDFLSPVKLFWRIFRNFSWLSCISDIFFRQVAILKLENLQINSSVAKSTIFFLFEK